jgi:hypothetical protein
VKVTEFVQPRADAFKFDAIGDAIDGVISQPPAVLPDKFNEGRTVLALTLDTANGETSLYARTGLLDAIVEAVNAAGVDEIDQGGALRVTYTGDRLLRNGYTMKVYTAEYVPPQPMGVGVLGDAEVWGPHSQQAAD